MPFRCDVMERETTAGERVMDAPDGPWSVLHDLQPAAAKVPWCSGMRLNNSSKVRFKTG